jgi:mannose-6-phosphate isomerase
MSFMFNPFDYDDQTAINRPSLDEDTVRSIVSGLKNSSVFISNLLLEKVGEDGGRNIIIALDGYIGAQWEQTINLLYQNLSLKSVRISTVNIAGILKDQQQLDLLFKDNLEVDRVKDPVLLFGKLFHGTFEDMFDRVKMEALKNRITTFKTQNDAGEVLIVYGCGCSVQSFRPFYDYIFYYDVTPKQVILRARNGNFANLGDSKARPIKEFLRRCYYVDFEVAAKLRWDLIKNNDIDFYVASDDPLQIKIIPKEAFNSILSGLVKYPMRCKPVYLEGVWGGYYMKKLRNLPDNMRNCAWIFDLIPLEVSIVVKVGDTLAEFPFFTFVQKEGVNLMGKECVKRFGGYFPIRFNYDDTYHSNGNMSVQVHSGHDYNIANYYEHGRQDESYYVVAAGFNSKTFIGFKDDADPDVFIKEVKKSEKEHIPVDYEKYVNSVPSRPGMQLLLPAGTIHSSGRNQVVLEIGSLTVGSYTYKLYDYLRKDLDGIPRPIHTWHGERVLIKERNSSWVKENLIQQPVLVREGEGWAEYVVGQHELLYFTLGRLEFQDMIEDDTNGKFHVLTLVDGEKVQIQSATNPELCFTQNYLEIIIVPATMGKYRIKNLGDQPVSVHKTMIKD